jgi:hypothetical protein
MTVYGNAPASIRGQRLPGHEVPAGREHWTECRRASMLCTIPFYWL